MNIVSVKHKGLKRLIEKDDDRLLPSQYRKKIRRLIAILIGGRPHRLKGDRSHIYSISVSPNWRLTFEYEVETNSIHILDYEDYH